RPPPTATPFPYTTLFRSRDKLASGSLGEPRKGEVLLTFPGEEEGRRPPARKPRWLLKPVPNPAGIRRIRGLLDELRLNTVCEDAGCPNRGQCWNDGTATFMILGSHCTRSCGFCKVLTGRPEALDP